MKRIIVIFVLVLFYYCLYAQVVIEGIVIEKGKKEPVAGANVMILSSPEKKLMGYCSTDVEGLFKVSVKDVEDSLILKITGFNVKTLERCYLAVTQKITMEVEFEQMSIREVVVKAEPIKRSNDTVSYYVANFIDSLDRSIGDVLRKMPGIEVDRSGKIIYNNKPISKFYIEGIDMMGGGYGVATNNVCAEDIAAVQILENHQPIKALQEISFSESSAINLKLKRKSKGAFAGTVMAGGGYKPWMWNGQLALMQFASEYQFLCTYKTNNSGNDITSETLSQFDDSSQDNSMIGIHKPSTPDTDIERYMDNVTHAVSVNGLMKIKEDYHFSINAKYIYDLQNYNAYSVTKYYLTDSEPLVIQENVFSREVSDNVEVRAKMEVNTKKVYFNEKVTFTGNWNRNEGMVLNSSDSIGQKFTLPKVSLKNNLDFLKVLGGGFRIRFFSVVDAAKLPATLFVTPGDITQIVENRMIKTNNYITGSYHFNNRYSISARVGFDADIKKINTSLETENVSDADSLNNDIYWQKFDINGRVGFSYNGNKVNFNVSSDFDYVNLFVKDYNLNNITRKVRFYFNPSISLNVKITPSLKFVVRGGLNNKLGSGEMNYSGYIMSDYRVISSMKGDIKESMLQNYSAEFLYGDAIISLFGTLGASYWSNKSNLMYSTTYVGIMSNVTSYLKDNTSQGYIINGRIEKRFDDISTNVAIPVSYMRSYVDIMRDGMIMKTISYRVPVGLEVSSHFCQSVRGDYKISYYRSRSIIEGDSQEITPMDALRQKLTLNFTMYKSLTFQVSGEHYFNSIVTSGSRSMFFADASIIYKSKHLEYILEGRNLLNREMYNQRVYTDITDYEYSYSLRPISVMFKVKFSLR